MKSKTSYFNKTIFLKNITHFWPIWLMFLVWNVFIVPFMIYNDSLQYKYFTDLTQKELEMRKSMDILEVVSIYCHPAVLFIFSVMAVMAVFSYLYNSRTTNAMHSFPVTRKELFFTNFISGLLFLILPETVGFLFGILVGAVCGYTSMNYLLLGLLYAFGISFVLYSFTVLIAMFTGQLMAIPIFAVILNFLYVGCKMLFCTLMSQISFGISLGFQSGKLDVLSPLYYLCSRVTINYGPGGVPIGMNGGKVIAVYAVAAVFCVVGAYLIYKVRNLETAGSLISIWWICPIFRWGAAVCGGGIFSIIFSALLNFSSSKAVFASAVASAIVFGTVFFFAAQMFLEKGFRVFKKKRLVECGVFLFVFVGLYISIEVDLFGIERKIPEASAVEKAYIEDYVPVGGTDLDTINQIIHIHEQIVGSKKEFEDYAAESQEVYYLGIKYKMKNGSSLERYYPIPWQEEMMTEQDSVAYQVIQITTSPEVYWKELFGKKKQNIKATYAEIDLYDEKTGEREDVVFSLEDTEKIYQAVLADIEEGNFKHCLIQRYFDDLRNESTYYNSIKLDYLGEENIIPVQMDYDSSWYENGEGSKSGSANIMFDKNCRHIIEALIDMGMIESENDLMTINEFYELEDAVSAEYKD